MQLFNLGIGEIFFILLIAGVVLGPNRIVTFSRQAGQWIRGLAANPLWQEIMATSSELRHLPDQLMEESGLQADVTGIREELGVLAEEIRSESTASTPSESQMDPQSDSPVLPVIIIDGSCSSICESSQVNG